MKKRTQLHSEPIGPPCDPSYAEVNHLAIVNWDYELFELKRHPDHEHRWRRLKILASGWGSCACGQLCVVIPRDGLGRPEDQELSKLGSRFCMAIEAEDRAEARHVLNLIEDRSAKLISEIYAQQSTDRITEDESLKEGT